MKMKGDRTFNIFDNQLHAQYIFYYIYIKITNSNMFQSLQSREVPVNKTAYKIAVNSCILKSCTPRSRRECEMYTVPYEMDVNTERYGILIIQCLRGSLCMWIGLVRNLIKMNVDRNSKILMQVKMDRTSKDTDTSESEQD